MTYIEHPRHPEGAYRIEDELYDNLKVLPKRIAKDSDVLGIFVGSPGDGKSTIAQQCAYLLDPSLSIESIKWSFEDYVKYSIGLFERKQSKGKAIIHDEGRESLSALSMMANRTRKFMNFLYENRQMNMYQFIITGDYFDLPKSIVMQRGTFLIWVHEDGEFDKGFFKFFSKEKMRKLYIYGKKERDMTASNYDFRGTFPRFYTVDEDAYRAMKKDSLKVDRYIQEEKGKKSMTIREWLYFLWNMSPNIKPSVIINNTTVDASYYFKLKKEWEVNCGDLLSDEKYMESGE